MGTGHLFTRRELYERVWAEAISALAKTLQVSDVWLAKTCRLSNIPLPPRGYWARLYAGQVVGKTPLPLCAPGESDQVIVGGGRYPHYRDIESKSTAAPQPPAYEETEEQVAARIDKMVPKGWRPARSLDAPYPAIARLLSEDQERRTARDRFPRSTYNVPRFESRVEQRRLLLISNLFGLLIQMDAQPAVGGNDARETSAPGGNQWVRFTVDTTAKLRPRRPSGKMVGRPDARRTTENRNHERREINAVLRHLRGELSVRATSVRWQDHSDIGHQRVHDLLAGELGWLGTPPRSEGTAKLRAKDLPLPARNAKGWLPRD